MSHPFNLILKQHLSETSNLRVALSRIFGNPPADVFYVNTCAALACFDKSIVDLSELESKYGIMVKLMPHGSSQQARKTLSYSGGIRKNRGLPLSLANNDPCAVRDPGNYCYGVIMRSIAISWSDQHWLSYSIREEWNDKTLGDILEAVLGVAWLHRHGSLVGGLAEVDILNQYTLAIEQCVIEAEKVIDLATNLGIWTDSKALAALLR